MSVQLFAKTQAGQTIQLDIYDQDPIKITMAVEEVMNAQQTAGTFSRTFRLPQTFKNQQFFQGVFNANSETFDATAQTSAWIQSDGFFFTSGNIRLTNVYLNNRENQIEYEALFMGETSDFSGAVGDGFLCELDFSEYVHNQTYDNIRNSWNAATSATGGTGLFSGNVLYPLVEHGYTYNQQGVINENSLTTGYTGSFTNSTKGLFQGQLKPALRVDAIWRKIFSNAGYGFTGAFFDSGRWKALYMISENEVRSIAEPDNTCSAFIEPNDYYADAYEIMYFNQFPVIFQDPGGNVDLNTGSYTASGTGSYSFTVDYNYETFTNNPSGGQIVMELYNVATGATLDTDNLSVTTGNDIGIATANFGPLTLNNGVEVGVRAFFNPGGFVGTSFMYIFGIDFACTSAPSFVNPTSFLPCNFKKMDFIKSIADRFKLVFEPSKEFEKTFEITPWVDWITQGTDIDWSQKLDGSKDFKMSPLFYTQKRELVYNDQDDSDYPNYSFTQDNKKPYGQYKLDSGIKLIKDTQEIKGIFAPTPLISIASATGGTAGLQFLIPSVAKDNAPTSALGKREPIIPKPRLVFYNGKRTAPVTWYLKNDSNTNVAQTVYPLVSSFESFPPTTSTLDLHWQNDPYLFDATTVGVTARSANTVFNEYWEDWYNSYYSPYGRIAEGYFFIHDEDVVDLKFNDRIYANNSWWNPTKVMDYELGGGGVTKVQLVKIGNVNVVAGFTGGATGATGVTGPTGATGGCVISCTQFAACNNNNFPIVYQYVDCNTGVLVTQSLPPLICQLLCACSTPYSEFPNFDTYVQGACPGYTGTTGVTGGSWGVVNDLVSPIEASYIPTFTPDPQVVEVQPYQSVQVCSGTAPYDLTGGTALYLGDCGGTGGNVNDDVFVTIASQAPNDSWSYSLILGQSENGVTFEPVWQDDFLGNTTTAYMTQQDFTQPNYYASLTYIVTTAPVEGTTQFINLYVGSDLLSSRDVTLVPVGESIEIKTPTPINGLGYNFTLVNILG